MDDEAIAQLAAKSASIASKSVKTIASTVDSNYGNKNLFLDKNLADAGFELGRAEEQYANETNDLGIFMTFNKDFKGKLKLTNYDQTGKKIDVAILDIDAKANDEKMQVFKFPHSDLGMTTYFILSKVE